MKRCILLIALLGTCVGALEIAALGGGNCQIWIDEYGYVGKGVGGHFGLLGSIGMTPSCLPVHLGIESGFILHNVTYYWADFEWRTSDGIIVGTGGLGWRYNNLVVPVLLKGTIKLTEKFLLGVGMGPSIIHNLSGSKIYPDWYAGRAGISEEEDFESDKLHTCLGWQTKGDLGIELLPKLWLKPSLTLQLNRNPDSPFYEDERMGNQATVFLSLGLVLKV